MLFDLRSRRRRHTVRVVYLFLAFIMLAGLVGVGIGTGNNNGGILNAFTNNGGGAQGAAVSQATAAAVKAIKQHPNSSAAWGKMLQARWSAAATGSNYNSTTGVFGSAGKAQLRLGAAAWQKYLTLTSGKPSTVNANTAAEVYQALGQWPKASSAWQYVIAAEPAGSTLALKGYLCTALTSYAAKNTSRGDLATQEALKLASKAQKLQFQTTLSAAKSSSATAAQDAATSC
ncbi:MAG: hypothetical protein ACRDKL_05200 [Solirubrobacteraceae bacterium]